MSIWRLLLEFHAHRILSIQILLHTLSLIHRFLLQFKFSANSWEVEILCVIFYDINILDTPAKLCHFLNDALYFFIILLLSKCLQTASNYVINFNIFYFIIKWILRLGIWEMTMAFYRKFWEIIYISEGLNI